MNEERVQQEYAEGLWDDAAPEPLWVGFALRTAQCECGQRFRPRTILGDETRVRQQYRVHWLAAHGR